MLSTFITPQYLTSQDGCGEIARARSILQAQQPERSALKWANAVLKVAASREYQERIKPKTQEILCECHPEVYWNAYKQRANYIYLLKGADLYKIGYSTWPYGRIHDLHNVVPRGVRVIEITEGTRDDEWRLHRRHRDRRMNGEWFDLSGLSDRDIGNLLFI